MNATIAAAMLGLRGTAASRKVWVGLELQIWLGRIVWE
jgi:hypothetical protein